MSQKAWLGGPKSTLIEQIKLHLDIFIYLTSPKTPNGSHLAQTLCLEIVHCPEKKQDKKLWEREKGWLDGWMGGVLFLLVGGWDSGGGGRESRQGKRECGRW